MALLPGGRAHWTHQVTLPDKDTRRRPRHRIVRLCGNPKHCNVSRSSSVLQGAVLRSQPQNSGGFPMPPDRIAHEPNPASFEPAPVPAYSLWQLVRYALRLGTLGFGGPVALVGYMHRDLVENRKWITEADYKEGLALAQLMPGPLAAQLAMYLGYVYYRNPGATLVGVAFVAPSFVMVFSQNGA